VHGTWLLAMWALGAVAFAATLPMDLVARPPLPCRVLAAADWAGLPRRAVYAVLLVAYTVAWPITAAVLALVATSRRG
jgi:hypothetical protein